MSTIDFVVRTLAGEVMRGSVGGEGVSTSITAGVGNDISLNLHQSSIRGYDRVSDDLMITLADGRQIMLEGYFVGAGEPANQLFMSTDGQLTRVQLLGTEGEALFAQYFSVDTFGKWTPDSALVFLDDGALIAPIVDEEVSMAAVGLLGPATAGAGAAAGVAALAAVPLVAGGIGDGSGGEDGLGSEWPDPTVNNASDTFQLNGDSPEEVVISGTAEPGSTIEVVVGDDTVTGTAGDDGTWETVFDGPAFPEDGTYTDVPVIITEPDGTESTLDGPSFEIDTTPPAVTVDSGTEASGEVFNADEHSAGVSISGTAEVGSSVTVTIGDNTQSVTVGDDGSWTASFDDTVLPAGDYTSDVTVVAEDSFGNTTTVTEQIRIDTVFNALTIDPITGDDLVNAAENAAGYTVTGTSEPGATVSVTFAGATTDVTTDASGAWSLAVAASALAAGEYDTSISAVTTDAAGNVTTTSTTISVDTEVSLSFETGSVAGDGVINATEQAAGVTLGGMASAGSGVVVTLAGVDYSTTTAADGSWSVVIPSAGLPTGEVTPTVTAVATDAAGNTATQSATLNIDTEMFVTVDTATVETDGVVNAAERADGVSLSGTSQPGASVEVTLGTATRTVTTAADGSWTASFAAAEIATGEVMMPISITATDAAGNTSSLSETLNVDTFVSDFAMAAAETGADGILSAAEAAAGLTLTGTTEPGSAVVLSIDGGASVNATVAADGSWSASFSEAQLPSGEGSATVTAVATDAAGNSETLSQSITFDTDAGLLTIDPDPVETDDVVNAVEASDGVTLTGTSTPGQMVTVTLAGAGQNVTTAADGSWSATFPAGQIAPGTYTAEISATITDSIGNVLTRTDSVSVDTEVVGFAIDAPMTADNVVNASEMTTGVTLSGMTEPGGTVSVEIDGVMRAAAVDAAGVWTLALDPSDLDDAAEFDASLRVVTTDGAGNTAEDTATFAVDTEVNTLTLDTPNLGGDSYLNYNEVRNPLSLTGSVESGSVVEVVFNGTAYAASVAGDGSWSVTIPASGLPSGTLEAPLQINATDAAGNMASISDSISIDTELPEAVSWEGYGRNHVGVDELRTEISDDVVSVGRLTDDGSGPTVEAVDIASSTAVEALGVTYHSFAGTVPDGSHLVLSTTDAAGNTAGAYLVTDDPSSTDITFTDELATALSPFNIETIDLEFDEDATLTITEDQIAALSETTDTLIIKGGADDTVTLAGSGATSNGAVTVDGAVYNSFTFGATTVLIDEDITSVNGVT